MIKNNNNKIFYIYLFILTLWCLPFLLYQDFYRDDYTRLVTGYAGWENAGRPLATLLYHFLSMDFGIIHNLYPLPLFLSVFILAYTFHSLHKHIKKHMILRIIYFYLQFCLLFVILFIYKI